MEIHVLKLEKLPKEEQDEGRARRSRNYPLDAFPWSEEQEEI